MGLMFSPDLGPRSRMLFPKFWNKHRNKQFCICFQCENIAMIENIKKSKIKREEDSSGASGVILLLLTTLSLLGL